LDEFQRDNGREINEHGALGRFELDS